VKPFKFITGGDIRHIDIGDFRSRGTDAQLAGKPIQPGKRAPCERLDPSVR
jgi:hypothetical protein